MSTKSAVHWFQIIRNKCFQMYDDDVQQPMSVSTSHKYSKVAKYPTRNIRTPVALVCGGNDSFVDVKSMLKELPPQTVATEIPHYEHLDFLWARDVESQVFQHVFDALDSFTDAEHTPEEYDRYHLIRNESLLESGFFANQRGNECDASTMAASSNDGQPSPQIHQHRAREPRNGNPTRLIAPCRPAEPESAGPSGPQPAEKLKGVGIRRRGVGGAQRRSGQRRRDECERWRRDQGQRGCSRRGCGRGW